MSPPASLILALLFGCAADPKQAATPGGRTNEGPSDAPNHVTTCHFGKPDLDAAIAALDSTPQIRSGQGRYPEIFSDAQRPAEAASVRDSDVAAFAKSLGKLSTLTAAKYDEATGEFFLVGSDCTNNCLDADDFFVALRAAAQGEQPAVTIDPGRTDQEMVVRHFGGTQDTHFGHVTFATDLFLKVGGFEHDNYSCGVAEIDLPNFSNELELLLREQNRGEGNVWHRFWIEPSRRRVALGSNGMAAEFDVAWTVNTELFGAFKSDAAKYGGSVSAAKSFAETLSQNTNALVERYGAFRSLGRLFVLDTMTKWMVDRAVPYDEAWLGYRPATVRTPRTIPAVTVLRRIESNGRRGLLGIYGGISFDIANKYRSSYVATASIDEALQKRPTGATTWTYNRQGTTYRAVAWTYKSRKHFVAPSRIRITAPSRLPQLEWTWHVIGSTTTEPPKPKTPTPGTTNRSRPGKLCHCTYRRGEAPPTSCADPRCG